MTGSARRKSHPLSNPLLQVAPAPLTTNREPYDTLLSNTVETVLAAMQVLSAPQLPRYCRSLPPETYAQDRLSLALALTLTRWTGASSTRRRRSRSSSAQGFAG